MTVYNHKKYDRAVENYLRLKRKKKKGTTVAINSTDKGYSVYVYRRK